VFRVVSSLSFALGEGIGLIDLDFHLSPRPRAVP
jgi:hypothetical protein